MSAGIYIHVPFCRRKCDYCAFYSEPVPDAKVPGAYVERLRGEIGERLAPGALAGVDTVYFGGGTPSLLDPDQVAVILRDIGDRLALAPGAEVTLEMNPGDLSRERLEGYVRAGVNRAVLGVQTLSERLHALIGRSSALCTGRDLDLFFGADGLEQCVDIIAGIPTQTGADLARDIDAIAGYRPAHVSAYLLALENHTPLASRMACDAELEAAQAACFEQLADMLGRHGYARYEISNYSLPGRESRHNMKYWRFEPYLGLGPGAHSFLGNERYINRMTVAGYIASDRVLLEHDERTGNSAMVEYLMTGLRLLKGISLRDMEGRLSCRLPAAVMERIAKAASEGMVIIEEDGAVRIRLSEKGLIVADRVIYSLVEPLM